MTAAASGWNRKWWENNLGVSDVEGYKRKKGVGRYWKYIKLCAALLLYLAAVRSNAHVQARAGYAAAFLNDRAVTAKEADRGTGPGSGKNWTVRERRRSGSMRFKKHIGPIQRMRH